jgi:hypothetical protein
MQFGHRLCPARIGLPKSTYSASRSTTITALAHGHPHTPTMWATPPHPMTIVPLRTPSPHETLSPWYSPNQLRKQVSPHTSTPTGAGCQGSFTSLQPKLSTGARIEIGIGVGVRTAVIAGIVILLDTRHKVENAKTETLQNTCLRSSVKRSTLIQRRRFASIGLIIQIKWHLWCTRTHSDVAQTGLEDSLSLSRGRLHEVR